MSTQNDDHVPYEGDPEGVERTITTGEDGSINATVTAGDIGPGEEVVGIRIGKGQLRALREQRTARDMPTPPGQTGQSGGPAR